MVGGTCQQSNPLSRLCSINTLANTMKHCINVSNYWLDGTLASGGRGVLRRCGDAIRMSHWLSISPTDVEKGLPIKTAQIRGGLSGNYMLCDLGKKIRKTRWWRKQGKSLNQNILKSIGSECHVNLFKYLAKILMTLFRTVDNKSVIAISIRRNYKAKQDLHLKTNAGAVRTSA